MRRFKKELGKKIIIGDGAFGSFLQEHVNGHFIPDELNLSKPGLIERVHNDYASCGADFISANTFGASPLKLKDVGLLKYFRQINEEAVKIARRVAEIKEVWVAGDIGPCGKLVEPLGDVSFDEVSRNYSEQAGLLEKEGVDFILLETITDIQELRAALVGILSTVKIPVLASMSFTNEDLSISGTDGEAFAVTADFPGLSAVGANCGTSLENMKKVIGKIAARAFLPILCQANAGLPKLENGKTVFTVRPAEYADYMEELYGLGVSVFGSCCGSTPEFTRKLSQKLKGRDVVKRNIDEGLLLSSRTGVKEVSDKKLFIVGERINPTGRKKLRKELEAGDLTTLRRDAKEQEKYGCDALDINVNLHKPDLDVARNVVRTVQNLVNLPLVIDTMEPALIEEFGKSYAGKGVINSISGERARMEKIMPLARKYNLAFIAVLMDEKGISDSAKERLKIAKGIVKRAAKYGIPSRNIIFDPLVLSAGAEVEKVAVTLETLRLLKKEFPNNKTIVGLSNVSFGLPNRELVNTAFLAMAVANGADMLIANPIHDSIRHQVLALDFLRSGSKENLAHYTRHFSGYVPGPQKTSWKAGPAPDQPAEDTLYENILQGDSQRANVNIKEILETENPADVIGKHVVPAMNEVGRRYQKKELFLPQLITAADVVKSILPFIKEKLAQGKTQADGRDAPPETKDLSETTVLFATVEGDVHDIGKNIVIGILESFNLTVFDLGKDVPPETIVSEALEKGAGVVGLSTLMTTTLPAMTETVKALRANEKLKDIKIFVGGAVIDQTVADSVGALYARDGMDMVKMIG